MLRHFAYFDGSVISSRQLDGERVDFHPYVREAKGDVMPPADGEDLTAWQDRVSGREPNEVCLDVTSFDYPVGDFCWMIFRPFDQTQPGQRGLLDWPDCRTFAEISPTLRLCAYVQSPRPVRPSAGHPIIVDVTGTWLEAYYAAHGPLFGQFALGLDGRWSFTSDDGRRALLPKTVHAMIDAASPSLEPIRLRRERATANAPSHREST